MSKGQYNYFAPSTPHGRAFVDACREDESFNDMSFVMDNGLKNLLIYIFPNDFLRICQTPRATGVTKYLVNGDTGEEELFVAINGGEVQAVSEHTGLRSIIF